MDAPAEQSPPAGAADPNGGASTATVTTAVQSAAHGGDVAAARLRPGHRLDVTV
uniref:hypothetical protein n=1 Tax=Paractinoplanes polyasparticus TaxID=2856853 RepID=UPI001C865615|nr:hypothetical protein [Actinoplanes polyasparticus]